MGRNFYHCISKVYKYIKNISSRKVEKFLPRYITTYICVPGDCEFFWFNV